MSSIDATESNDGRHDGRRDRSDDGDLGAEFPSSRFLFASPPPSRGDFRKPWRAGRDYPADVVELRRALEALLPKPATERALGLVVPHGPLRYCGAITAAALARASCDETAIVLAPNHAARGPRAVVASHGGFSIPGAAVAIEERLAETVRHLGGLTEAPDVFDGEHAIESILPLLVASRPRVSIVPVLLHDVSRGAAARIGASIADAVVGRGGGTTIVVTTDLVHYADVSEVDAIDASLLARIVALDEEGLDAELDALSTRSGPLLEMCGLGALRVGMHALRALGAKAGVVAAHGSSASMNDGSAGRAEARCVGYGSAYFPGDPCAR